MTETTYTEDYDLKNLNPIFRDTARGILRTLKREGWEFWILGVNRSPLNQARLWCQSRTHATRLRAIEWLHQNEAPYLAATLQRAHEEDPRGPHRTNQLPGFSLHQYGLAVDVAWVGPDGELQTITKAGVPDAYKRLRAVVETAGAWHGSRFVRREWDHFQEGKRTANERWTIGEMDFHNSFFWGGQEK